jgi:tRNA pseudouridine38-40 synthase
MQNYNNKIQTKLIKKEKEHLIGLNLLSKKKIYKQTKQNIKINKKDILTNELNKILPSNIYIKNSQLKANFHARFDAKKRVYRYILAKNVNVFENNYIHKLEKKLNKKRIKKALPLLIGIHNFKNFCKGELKEKNKIREIYSIKFYSHKINNKKIWVFSFCANSYLRSQIRMIISFLIKISNKELGLKELKMQLKHKKISNTLVSPNGLYLLRIFY